MSDVIDLLVGIEPGSPIDVVRRRRPDAREHAQQSFLALLEPNDPGGLSLAHRYAVAAYTALLHEAGTPTRSSALYLELLADEDAELVAPIRRAAAAGIASGPTGEYREPALHAESVAAPPDGLDSISFETDSPRAEPLRADLLKADPLRAEPLIAALRHTHLLVLHPRDARSSHAAALEAAGWGPDEIVTISQLVAFLAFQLRVVDGLRVLQATRVRTTATDTATNETEASR